METVLRLDTLALQLPGIEEFWPSSALEKEYVEFVQCSAQGNNPDGISE